MVLNKPLRFDFRSYIFYLSVCCFFLHRCQSVCKPKSPLCIYGTSVVLLYSYFGNIALSLGISLVFCKHVWRTAVSWSIFKIEMLIFRSKHNLGGKTLLVKSLIVWSMIYFSLKFNSIPEEDNYIEKLNFDTN